MEKARIVNIAERRRHVAPGKVEVDLEIMYKSAKGFEGTVTVPKVGATEDSIWAAVFADMEVVEKVIGKER